MIWPSTVNLRADRHADLLVTFLFEDDGTPVDLSGCTIDVQIRNYADAPGAALVDLATVGSSTEEGVFVSDAVNGEVALLVKRATHEAFPANYDPAGPRRFAWDLRVTYPDGLSEIFLTGRYTLYAGVVRDA